MNEARDPTTQKILDLTLEIIYLLTGEDHIVVKIHETIAENSSRRPSEGCSKTQHYNKGHPPPSLVHEGLNEQKILELSNQIIRLLTGEVPIRCEDVTVYLSMEEWEYVERHKELYEDVMMEDHQPVITRGDLLTRQTPGPSSDFGTKTLGNERFTNNGEKCPYITKKEQTKCATYPEPKPAVHKHLPVTEIGIDLPPDQTQSAYPPFIKQEPASCEKGNLTDSDMYEPTNHTQTHYTSTHIKAESDTCGEGDITDPDIYPTAEHAQTIYARANLEEYLEDNENPLAINPSQSLIESSKRKLQYKCSECGKCFTQSSSLVAHKRIHTGEKPFQCAECGKCFIQASNLTTHKMIHTGEKPFKCTECGKCFTRASNLTIHKKIHVGEKPFKCTECGKCFNWASSLSKHKMFHAGVKPLNCPDCGKCFIRASDLTTHRKIHTEEKPFKCTECGKYFYWASELARHKMLHTGEKPFKCSDCGKCFSRATNLKAHTHIHMGEKPFNCTECRKSFIQSSALTAHKNIHMAGDEASSRGEQT